MTSAADATGDTQVRLEAQAVSDAASVSPAPIVRTLRVRRLGRMGYEEALDLQKRLVEERRTSAIGDTLLLVEHPPVITLGARNRISVSHIVDPRTTCGARG